MSPSDLLTKLVGLGPPCSDFVILGNGPLWAHGLIDTPAEWFLGLPFAQLEYVMAFKRVLHRDRDTRHTHLIEDHLALRIVAGE